MVGAGGLGYVQFGWDLGRPVRHAHRWDVRKALSYLWRKARVGVVGWGPCCRIQAVNQAPEISWDQELTRREVHSFRSARKACYLAMAISHDGKLSWAVRNAVGMWHVRRSHRDWIGLINHSGTRTANSKCFPQRDASVMVEKGEPWRLHYCMMMSISRR